MSDHVELVQELGRRFRAGDREGAFELLHPDLRIQQPASLPHGGWHSGHVGMIEMSGSFGGYWTRTMTDPVVYGCEEVVVQITTQTWTSTETRRSATVDVVELFSFTGGLISEIRVFQQDTHLLLETLADRVP